MQNCLYDKGKVPTAKKVTLALNEKTVYKGSVHILFIYFYEIVQFCSYKAWSGIKFPNTCCYTHMRKDKPATPQQLPIGSHQMSRDNESNCTA
jgi:hypothetical protein